MALKHKVSHWHSAICHLTEEEYRESIQRFLQISNPSAKIIYNLGCVYMLLEDYDRAIQYFSNSINKDRYLFVAYFLRGVCHCREQRFDLAEKDFSAINSALPTETINYRQIGAPISLERKMIKEWLRASESAGRGRNWFPSLSPVMDFIFRPPKAMVQSLQKGDFLGKAKVISSVQEADIVYATEKKMNSSAVPPNQMHSLLGRSPPLSPSLRPKNAIPPPPTRRAPHLTKSMKDRCKKKWRSMENLCEDSDNESDFSSTSSGGRRPASQCVDDRRTLDYRYSQLDLDTPDTEQAYQPLEEPVSKPSPQIKMPLQGRLLPPRPKPGIKLNGMSQPSSPTASTFASPNIPRRHDKDSERGQSLSPVSQPFNQHGIGTPPLKAVSSTTPDSSEGSKSVLARAHPDLFKGIFLPPGSRPGGGGNTRQPPQDMRDCRGPAIVKQPPSPTEKLHIPNSQNNGRQRSPKPARPPPPKLVR